MSDPLIHTRHLTLRRFRANDAAAMHAIFTDAAAMRFWSTLLHTTVQQTQAWIDSTTAAVAAGTADEFAVEHAGAVIGKAGLWQGSEIGFIFARAVWGRGLAAEAVAAVCARATALGRDLITADVDPRNDRALALLTRLGFTETGRAERTFCLAGESADSVYLELRPG